MAGKLLNLVLYLDRSCRTSLHWACHRGHLVIIKILLQYGADVSLVTHKGETAIDLAHSREVLELIAPNELLADHVPVKTTHPLPIIPHYLEHQEFPYNKRREELLNNELLIHGMEHASHCVGNKRKVMDATQGFKKLNNGADDALMIKCRVAGKEDDDFIEVEVTLPTFNNLLQSCCEELQINSDCVSKLRKLPNVIIRNDKDVVRLLPYQEIELVLK